MNERSDFSISGAMVYTGADRPRPATLNPAVSLGVKDRDDLLETGSDADLVVLDEQL